jgi:hypothetical protein
MKTKLKGGQIKMPKIPIREKMSIDEGKHIGKIVRVEYRHHPYEYCDIIVSVDNSTEITLKYGCPTLVSVDSKLGKLLALFGVQLVAGQDIAPEDILMGTSELQHVDRDGVDEYSYLPGKEKEVKVSYMTINETVTMKDKSQKEFARIVEGSLKPLK